MPDKRQLGVLVLLPLFFGFIQGRLGIVLPPFLVQIGIGALWFWTGMQFARYFRARLLGIVVGNILWGASLLLFVWQFLLTADEARNFALAGLSQWYMQSFIWAGTRIGTALRPGTIIGDEIILASYGAMLLTFLAGFLFVALTQRANEPAHRVR